MRVMYRVVGGRFPFGFMSELQVTLAQTHCVTEDPENAIHFAPENPVNRIAGSVLSVVYDCFSEIIREWAVVSRGPLGVNQANADAPGSKMDCIRVMGWAEFADSSPEGVAATDWRLFRMVMQEIEGTQKSQPELCLQKKVLFVDDATGQPAEPVEVECAASQMKHLTFALTGGGRRTLSCEAVIPSGSKIKLEAAPSSA